MVAIFYLIGLYFKTQQLLDLILFHSLLLPCNKEDVTTEYRMQVHLRETTKKREMIIVLYLGRPKYDQ